MNVSAERIYARVAHLDVNQDGVLEAIAEALGLGAVEIDEVARGTDTHAPWARILDPVTCPVWALPWLAQWVGERLLPSDTEADQRARIAQAAGFYRSTDRAMREEVSSTLTSRDPTAVTVLNRVGGDRWSMTVITRTSDTPNSARSEAAARRQKPAGVVLTFLTSDDVFIDEGTEVVDNVAVSIDTTELGDVT